MFKLPFYGKKKLLLAFEYGSVLADVLKTQRVEFSPSIIDRCEKIILKEFTEKSADRVALEMVPNILASLEVKE